MKKRILLLFIAVCSFAIGYSQTVYKVTADTNTAATGNKDENYGRESINGITVKTHRDIDNGSTRKAYLKFEPIVVPAGDEVTSATLTIRVFYAGVIGLHFNLYGILDNSWKEDEITWSNAPAMDQKIGVLTIDEIFEKEYETYKDYTLDVTSFVKSQTALGENIISLGLYDDDAQDAHIRFFSKESLGETAQAAQLTVTTAIATSIATTSAISSIVVSSNQNQIAIRSTSEINSVKVFSLSGATVYNSNNVGNTVNINVPQKGIYVVQVVSGAEKISKKVVVN